MDKMSLFSLLTVSTPEAIANVFIGFLLVGEKKRLISSKKNIGSLILTIFLMVSSSYVIRIISPNSGIVLLLHMVAYMVIFKLVYELSIIKSICISIFSLATLVTIELLYAQYCIIFLTRSLKNLYSNDIFRLVCTIPERVIQAGLIVSFWNWDVVLINMKKYRMIKWSASIGTVLLLGNEGYILFKFLSSVENMSILEIIGNTVSMIGFVIFNLIFFKIITRLTKTIRMETLSKNEKCNIIKLIKKHLNSGETQKAIDVIENDKDQAS